MSARRYGSLHTGFGEWLWQRLTAVYMGAFTLYFVVYLLSTPSLGQYKVWRDWFAGGAMRIALALFFASLLIHAWIGLRSVIIDYVKPLSIRFSLLALIGAALAAHAIWITHILLGL